MDKTIIRYLVAFLLSTGCRHPCINTSITPVFIGFSSPDIDTIILRSFKPNDNYLHPVDSFLIAASMSGIYTTSNDTTVVFVNVIYPENNLSSGMDWQIYIPAKKRTVSISNIISKQITAPGRSCLNPISSFIQDGQYIVPQLVETGQPYTSGYLAYIKN